MQEKYDYWNFDSQDRDEENDDHNCDDNESDDKREKEIEIIDNNDNNNIIDNTNDKEITATLFEKQEPKINNNFPLSPLSELMHLYIKWIINKIIMDLYIHNYIKQEDYAMNSTNDKNVRHFWCIHVEKYNNHHKLSIEVFNSHHHEEASQSSIFPIIMNSAYSRSIYSTKIRDEYEIELYLLYCIYRKCQ